MADEKKTCQEPMRYGHKCGRDVWEGDGKYCICHSPDCNKDVHKFNEEIDFQKARRGPYIDYTGFVFPKGARTGDFHQRMDVIYTNAKFLGDVVVDGSGENKIDWTGAVFGGTVSMTRYFQDSVFIRGATFKEDADFTRCTFQGHFDAQDVTFEKQCNFDGTTFHSDANWAGATSKDLAQFNNGTFKGAIYFNNSVFDEKALFRGCGFEGPLFMVVATFSESLDMQDATFGSSVQFSSTVCKKNTIFTSAHFHGRTLFTRVEFRGKAIFELVRWSGEVDFKSTVFGGPADFRGMKCLEGSSLLFDGEDSDSMFTKETDFTLVWPGAKGQLTFRKANLGMCRFLETDVSVVDFIAVDWQAPGGPKDRYCTRDEVPRADGVAVDYGLLAHLYRRLQASYMTNFDYDTAGGFYVAEQETKVKIAEKEGACGKLILLHSYKCLSQYGQSVWRPFLWLAATLVLVPLLLLLCGIDFQSDGKVTRYVLTCYPHEVAGPFVFFKDLVHAIGLNIWMTFVDHRSIADHLTCWPEWYLVMLPQLIIVAINIPLFLLALRRRFKRRSF